MMLIAWIVPFSSPHKMNDTIEKLFSNFQDHLGCDTKQNTTLMQSTSSFPV